MKPPPPAPGRTICRGLLVAVKDCSRRRKQRVAFCGVCGSSMHHTPYITVVPEGLLCTPYRSMCAADVTVTRNASYYFYGTVRTEVQQYRRYCH